MGLFCNNIYSAPFTSSVRSIAIVAAVAASGSFACLHCCCCILLFLLLPANCCCISQWISFIWLQKKDSIMGIFCKLYLFLLLLLLPLFWCVNCCCTNFFLLLLMFLLSTDVFFLFLTMVALFPIHPLTFTVRWASNDCKRNDVRYNIPWQWQEWQSWWPAQKTGNSCNNNPQTLYSSQQVCIHVSKQQEARWQWWSLSKSHSYLRAVAAKTTKTLQQPRNLQLQSIPMQRTRRDMLKS